MSGWTLELPWPPSVNNLWRRPTGGPLAGRTLLSRAARDYKADVAKLVLTQRVTPFRVSEGLGISIKAYPPDRRRRDLDNLLKIVLDSLQGSGVIPDDHQVEMIGIWRMEVIPRGKLSVSAELRT